MATSSNKTNYALSMQQKYGEDDEDKKAVYASTMAEKYAVSAAPLVASGEVSGVADSGNFFQHEIGDETATSVLKAFGNANIAGAESVAAIGSGMVGGTIAGVVALGEGAYDAITGKEDVLDSMVERIEKVQKSLTYMPRNEMSKVALDNISQPFQKLEDGKKALGDWVQEETGVPELATAAYMAPDVLLMMLGSRPRMGQRLDAKKLQAKADELGINLNAQKTFQGEQIAEAAESMVGPVKRTTATPEVAAELEAIKGIQKSGVDTLYEQARSAGPAGVPKQAYNDVFAPMIEKSMRPYDLTDMPIVRARIEELQKLGDSSAAGVSIDALERWRQRVNRNSPKVGDTRQQGALSIIKAQYDEFRDAVFNVDMITGDATAVTKWKNATAAAAAYAKNFKDSKVIKQLIEKQATPEEARNWIFGAADAGFSAQAGRVVGAIEKVVGKNSKTMETLRQDAMFNILDPLFESGGPNLKKFVNNYDKIARKNPTVMKTLFGSTKMKDLRAFAAAVDKFGTDNVNVIGKMSNLISRVSVGHQMSIASAKVGLVERMLDLVSRGAGSATRRRIYAEILGYESDLPLFPFATKEAGAIGASLETLENE